ncbi:uncharacterized protein LOC120847909 [Ixodes scapularis]|uniref:uncharacterized protein LOC120847909 n=1 Tax=Ixodes scapularis TaxID=6945 RepID=UPI001A9EE7CF|nr:uncharacterized protein LOC120847909 [Ixodes scapularis]
MSFALIITAQLVLHCTSASTQYLERNPALQEYQNEAAAFPLQETWYMAYRNYETDPFFGGTAKCVRISETDPGQDGVYPLVLHYDPDVSIDLTLTLSSSPGYTLKNIGIHQAVGQNDSAEVYCAFKNVKMCDVLRIPYAGDGACALLVPKSQLGSHEACCDFIFDLLCGSTPKFDISDSSCP